jgi:hypothetical protein
LGIRRGSASFADWPAPIRQPFGSALSLPVAHLPWSGPRHYLDIASAHEGFGRSDRLFLRAAVPLGLGTEDLVPCSFPVFGSRNFPRTFRIWLCILWVVKYCDTTLHPNGPNNRIQFTGIFMGPHPRLLNWLPACRRIDMSVQIRFRSASRATCGEGNSFRRVPVGDHPAKVSAVPLKLLDPPRFRGETTKGASSERRPAMSSKIKFGVVTYAIWRVESASGAIVIIGR